ncbi:MAG: hypothetical protein II520_01520, partial [Bacilli bacterium]|nr:hypothetical protein [Bacilli bacterium]
LPATSVIKPSIVHHLSHHRKTVNEKYAFSIVRRPKCLENRGNIVRQILQRSKKVAMASTPFFTYGARCGDVFSGEDGS